MSDLDPTEPELTYTPEPPIAPARSKSDAAWLFVGADGLRAGWSIAIFVLLFVIINIGFQYGLAKARHKPFPPTAQTATTPASTTPTLQAPLPMIAGEGAAFLAVVLAAFIMSKIERRSAAVYGFGGTHRLAQFSQGLLWGFVCLSFLVAILYLAGLLHFDGRLLSNTAALRYGLIWALGFTLVGFLEESLTRGYLQYTLTRGFAGIYGAIFRTRHRHALGFWTAALLFSFLFGLGHKSNAGESPLGLVAAGVAGLVFCLALYRTGSLWWALGFHASWDWAQSFLYGVADSGTMVRGHLYATHPVGRPILSGGLTGPEGSIFVLVALGAAATVIILTLPKPITPAPVSPTPTIHINSNRHE